MVHPNNLPKMLTDSCPECKRVFASIYPEQLKQWISEHRKTHKNEMRLVK